MTDTLPDVEARYRAMLAALSPERRVAMTLSMNETARRIVLSSLPDGLDRPARRAAFLRRYYGDELSETAIVAVANAMPGDAAAGLIKT